MPNYVDEDARKGLVRVWIDYTVDVDVGAAELYALLSDLDGWPTWTPGLRAIRRKRSAPLVPGASFTMVLDPGLVLPCKLYVREPERIEWGGDLLGSVIRHRFELKAIGAKSTRLRHVEYATNFFAVLAFPAEKGILGHDKRWSNAIRKRFSPA